MNKVSILTHRLPANFQKKSLSTATNFVSQRSKYQGELSELRKAWQSEHQQKLQLKNEQKKAEQKRITLERAVRLRETRRLSQARQEQVKLERERARLRIQENLARTQLLWEGRQQIRKQYDIRAKADLVKESTTWIAPEDIATRINEDLFAKPSATTGLVTTTSNHWKYQVFTPKFERLLSEDYNDPSEDNPLWYQHFKSDYRVTKKIAVDDFLHQLIGTGKERAEFKQLSKDMSAIIASKGGFDQLFDGMIEDEMDVEEEEVEEGEGVEVLSAEGGEIAVPSEVHSTPAVSEEGEGKK